MENAKLSLVKKIYLANRARSDIKRGVFDKPFDRKAEHAELWCIFPFVWKELARVDAQRDRLMEKKQCSLTAMSVEDNAPADTKRFGESIAWLFSLHSIPHQMRGWMSRILSLHLLVVELDALIRLINRSQSWTMELNCWN